MNLVVPLWPPDTVRVEHTRQRYDQTHELRERGLSMRAIARKLDLNFKTVRRYLRADSVETLLVGGVRSSVLDSFKPYLHDRLADGMRNSTVLIPRSPSGDTPAAMSPFAATCGRYATSRQPLPPLPGRPAVRQVAGWITGLPGRLDPADAEHLRAIRASCPEIDAAVRRVAGFARMIKDLSGDKDALTKWMSAVDADPAAAALVHRRAAPRPGRRGRRPHPGVQLRRFRGNRQPHQAAQGRHVRTSETRPPPQAHTPGLNDTPGGHRLRMS
jgi:hypothetical protein